MSYLSLAKKFVKQSKFGSQMLSLLPKRVLYGALYGQIRQLYEWQAKGETDKVDLFLRRRMRKTLQDALINVPWYRQNVAVDPNSITPSNVYDKLLQFPYTSKQLVMENWDGFLNQKYSKKNLRYGSTEGTTGQGVVIANTYNDIVSKIPFFESDLSDVGYDYLKSRILRIGLDALRAETDYPVVIRGNRCYVSPIHLNNNWFPEIYRMAKAYLPDVIHSYPSLLFLLANYIVENSLSPIPVKCLFLASDTFLYQHYIVFKKAFVCERIYCIYGMSERVLLGSARIDEQNHTIGYQLNNLYGYAENLKNEFGNYELVGTGYWMEAMPFIRYRTNDFGKIDEAGFVKHLDGRGNTYLTTKKGYKVAGISLLDFENYFWDYIRAIQLVQEKPGDLILRIVPKETFSEEIGTRMLVDMEKNWPGLFDYEIRTATEVIKGRSLKANSIIVNC